MHINKYIVLNWLMMKLIIVEHTFKCFYFETLMAMYYKEIQFSLK